MKALVIDDSKAIRAVLSRYLNELGFDRILQAGDYDEAMSAFRAEADLDVAIVDWNLPGPSGFEILCEVRRHPEWNDVPLVMCTTETEFGQMEKALAAGADEYIMKPFTRLVVAEKLGLVGITRKG